MLFDDGEGEAAQEGEYGDLLDGFEGELDDLAALLGMDFEGEDDIMEGEDAMDDSQLQFDFDEDEDDVVESDVDPTIAGQYSRK
eukprot:UN10043